MWGEWGLVDHGPIVDIAAGTVPTFVRQKWDCPLRKHIAGPIIPPLLEGDRLNGTWTRESYKIQTSPRSRATTFMSVLRHTFLHLPGIGPLRERTLWQQGILDWSGFLAAAEKGRLRPAFAGRLTSPVPRLARRLAPRQRRVLSRPAAAGAEIVAALPGVRRPGACSWTSRPPAFPPTTTR